MTAPAHALEQHAAYLTAPRSPRFWQSEAPGYSRSELDRAEINLCFIDATGGRWIVPSCRHCGRAHAFSVERLATGASWRSLQNHTIDGHNFWLVPTPNRRAEAFFDGGRVHVARRCKRGQS